MPRARTKQTASDAPTARPDHHGPSVAAPDVKPRRSWGRRLIRLSVVLLLLLVVLVVAAPKLLSTGPGTRLLLSQVNPRIDGKVAVQDLSLGWFAGQRADGVSWASADGSHRFTAGSVEAADVSLWSLLTGDRKLGVVKVRDLHGVSAEPPEQSRATADEGPAPADAPSTANTDGWAKGLSFEVQVDGMSWRYEASGVQPVDVVSPRVTSALTLTGEASLRGAGSVKQAGESGRFEIDAVARGMFDVFGRLQPSQADYAVKTSVQQVPVDALSRLLAKGGGVFGSPETLAELLGGRWAAGQVNITGTLAELDATLRLHTDLLDTDLTLTSRDGVLTAGEGTTLSWTMTPAAFAALFPDRGLVLDAPITLTCEKPTLEMPVADSAVVLEQVVLRAVVNSGDWSLTDRDGTRIALAAPRLGVVGETLGEDLVAVLESVAMLAGPGGAAAASADVDPGPQPATARLRMADLFSGEPSFTLRLTDAPTAVVEWAYGGMGGLAAAVGPVVQSADVRVEAAAGRVRGGSLAVNWDASRKTGEIGALAVLQPIPFVVDDAGIVTLASGQDLRMQLTVTEALSNHWLGQINSIFFDAASADRPIRLKIEGDTFAYPLGASGLSAATIDAWLDLGTVRFGEQGLLGRIVEWADHPGEQAVFTPATLAVRDGELRYDELALTVGNIDLRFRGAVDLVAQSLTEMSVRVPSASLLNVFHDLEGVVEPDDELVIPMRGGLRDPEVDMEAFRSEIVRLLSEQPRRAAERELGRFFDRVRETVEGEVGEEGGNLAEEALRRLLGGGRVDDE